MDTHPHSPPRASRSGATRTGPSFVSRAATSKAAGLDLSPTAGVVWEGAALAGGTVQPCWEGGGVCNREVGDTPSHAMAHTSYYLGIRCRRQSLCTVKRTVYVIRVTAAARLPLALRIHSYTLTWFYALVTQRAVPPLAAILKSRRGMCHTLVKGPQAAPPPIKQPTLDVQALQAGQCLLPGET